MENKHPYDMTVEELLTVNINHIIHNLPLRQIKQTGIKELMEELQSANNDLEIAELHADILAAARNAAVGNRTAAEAAVAGAEAARPPWGPP